MKTSTTQARSGKELHFEPILRGLEDKVGCLVSRAKTGLKSCGAAKACEISLYSGDYQDRRI